jgi:hypothetical protein
VGSAAALSADPLHPWAREKSDLSVKWAWLSAVNVTSITTWRRMVLGLEFRETCGSIIPGIAWEFPPRTTNTRAEAEREICTGNEGRETRKMLQWRTR